jgi:penicillin V acylase-like amidase (Ntn superfamily)
MCCRIFWEYRTQESDGARSTIVGRVMDFESWHRYWKRGKMGADIWVFPRNLARNENAPSGTFKWQSKWGSVAAAVSWEAANGSMVAATTDGVNEKRLAGHVLTLVKSAYPSDPGDGRDTLNAAMWLQYYLDKFASVKEVYASVAKAKNRSKYFEEPFRLQDVKINGRTIGLHMALEDETGAQLLMEYDGKSGKSEFHVHRGRRFPVVTNDLTCSLKDKRILKEYVGFGGPHPVPGSTDSKCRFVRASYYLKNLPKARNQREALAYLMSVLRNVSQPFGDRDMDVPPGEWTRSTWWRSICDLSDRRYFFESTISPNLIWVRLNGVNFRGPVMKLDMTEEGNLDRSGDVSRDFKKAEPFTWPTSSVPG